MSAALPILQRPNSCAACSLYETGRGFALDVGDPVTARIAIMLETPAAEEVNFNVIPPPAHLGVRQVLGTVKEAQEEALRRSATYPDVPGPLRSRGVPVVGRTGAVLNRLLRQAGIVREHCLIQNTLRCFPPKAAKGDNYPTGNDKNIAQATCRQYDRLGEGPGHFSPDVIVVSLHPASLFKEGASSGEPLILADLEKVACFARQGLRVLLLMGGHACEVFLGFGSNVSRFRGHYEWTSKEFYNWYENRINKLNAKAEKARRAAMPKVPREKKKTKAEVAREGLAARVIDAVFPFLRTQGTCCCGSSFMDRESTVAELTGRVLVALTPAKKEFVEEDTISLPKEMKRTADISPCGKFRYKLTRTWDETKTILAFMLINPSDADADIDDPTVRRCIGFGLRLGYGGIEIYNPLAYRTPDVKKLQGVPDIEGPLNRDYLAAIPQDRVLVVGWGNLKTKLPKNMPWEAWQKEWLSQLAGRQLKCLAMTGSGFPQHPLMAKYVEKLLDYPPKPE